MSRYCKGGAIATFIYPCGIGEWNLPLLFFFFVFWSGFPLPFIQDSINCFSSWNTGREKRLRLNGWTGVCKKRSVAEWFANERTSDSEPTASGARVLQKGARGNEGVLQQCRSGVPACVFVSGSDLCVGDKNHDGTQRNALHKANRFIMPERSGGNTNTISRSPKRPAGSLILAAVGFSSPFCALENGV